MSSSHPTPAYRVCEWTFTQSWETCKWHRQSFEKHISASLLAWLGFLTLALVPLPWEHNSGSLLENETNEAELNWLLCSSWGLRHLRAQPESPKPPSLHTVDHRHMSEPSQIQLRPVPARSQPEHSWEKNNQLLFQCTLFWGGLLYSDSWQMQVGRKNLLEEKGW